jgi:hypothetical protein
LYEDSANATTDTKSHLVDSRADDDDDNFDPDEDAEDFEVVQQDYHMSL